MPCPCASLLGEDNTCGLNVGTLCPMDVEELEPLRDGRSRSLREVAEPPHEAPTLTICFAAVVASPMPNQQAMRRWAARPLSWSPCATRRTSSQKARHPRGRKRW